mgnify:CR=1 FL=1
MNGIDYIALEITALEPFIHSVQMENGGWLRTSDRRSEVALDCGSLQVQYGEIIGVLGDERSAKDSLIHAVAARLLTDDHRITVYGPGLLQDETAVKCFINRVLANTARFQRLTPLQVLIYGARLYTLEEQEARSYALAMLGQMGISEEAALHPVEELAPVEQQQIVAACAALTQPVFLLLDEPTRGLSACSARAIRSFLRELRDAYNATILLITADDDEIIALCDRLIVLQGRDGDWLSSSAALDPVNDCCIH